MGNRILLPRHAIAEYKAKKAKVIEHETATIVLSPVGNTPVVIPDMGNLDPIQKHDLVQKYEELQMKPWVSQNEPTQIRIEVRKRISDGKEFYRIIRL